jgi:hypothetical protein
MWLQTILQSHSCKNSLVLAQEEAQRLMKQNGIPRNKSTHLQPSDFFTNETKAYIGEKTACSTNGTGKTGYWHAKYWNEISVFHSLSINSQWIKDLNVRPEDLNLLLEKNKENTGTYRPR